MVLLAQVPEQYLMLAGMARDAGDLARARALAEAVRGWARELGIGLLELEAAAIAGGQAGQD